MDKVNNTVSDRYLYNKEKLAKLGENYYGATKRITTLHSKISTKQEVVSKIDYGTSRSRWTTGTTCRSTPTSIGRTRIRMTTDSYMCQIPASGFLLENSLRSSTCFRWFCFPI